MDVKIMFPKAFFIAQKVDTNTKYLDPTFERTLSTNCVSNFLIFHSFKYFLIDLNLVMKSSMLSKLHGLRLKI